MKRSFFSFFPRLSSVILVASLVACGSNVKLSDVPVEDLTGANANPGGAAGAGAGGVGSSSVAPVQIAPADTSPAGPANVAKVIYFDYDSFAIKPEFQSAIDAHARFLIATKTRRVAIEGHTDERGGREYNLALGQKRAEAVRRALGLLGVGDAQVEAVSFGKEKPSASGADEAAFAKNRRAELSYR
ncbi:MAG: peptidoglycan-associated lipoprotein Pal [Polaromonas sp.]|nr:peptidoglycan-associated lipoprotein Pal [Polaromonas sp.]